MSRFVLEVGGRLVKADDVRVDRNGNYQIIEPYTHTVKTIPKDAVAPGSIRRVDSTILPGGNIFAPKFPDGLAD